MSHLDASSWCLILIIIFILVLVLILVSMFVLKLKFAMFSYRYSYWHSVLIPIIAQVLFALWHDRRQRSFNTTTSWWRQLCKMIWDLRWHLSPCGSSVLMKVKQLRTTENKRACASDCALTSTSFCLHNWTSWIVSYMLMPETLRIPQSERSRYCCTRSKDLLTSTISSSICGTRISSICFRFPGTHCRYHKYQQS